LPLILVADDSPTIRGFVRLALRGLPVEIVDAEDGSQALEKARAQTPTLALIDVNMPVLDGLGALRGLRADPSEALRRVPVVMLTAERSDEVLAACRAAGADSFVAKPLKLGEVRAEVVRLLGLGGEGAR
jgi:two-component system chemotaxis response regulator CheY